MDEWSSVNGLSGVLLGHAQKLSVGPKDLFAMGHDAAMKYMQEGSLLNGAHAKAIWRALEAHCSAPVVGAQLDPIPQVCAVVFSPVCFRFFFFHPPFPQVVVSPREGLKQSRGGTDSYPQATSGVATTAPKTQTAVREGADYSQSMADLQKEVAALRAQLRDANSKIEQQAQKLLELEPRLSFLCNWYTTLHSQYGK